MVLNIFVEIVKHYQKFIGFILFYYFLFISDILAFYI